MHHDSGSVCICTRVCVAYEQTLCCTHSVSENLAKTCSTHGDRAVTKGVATTTSVCYMLLLQQKLLRLLLLQLHVLLLCVVVHSISFVCSCRCYYCYHSSQNWHYYRVYIANTLA
jgi:hypothetical protein